jgi:hypothetical protein
MHDNKKCSAYLKHPSRAGDARKETVEQGVVPTGLAMLGVYSMAVPDVAEAGDVSPIDDAWAPARQTAFKEDYPNVQYLLLGGKGTKRNNQTYMFPNRASCYPVRCA